MASTCIGARSDYLNEGYNVYLNGHLLGHSPDTEFPLRGLDAASNYTARVKSVWEDGREAGNTNSRINFTISQNPARRTAPDST